jgi:hypothetical protein
MLHQLGHQAGKYKISHKKQKFLEGLFSTIPFDGVIMV